MNNDNSTEKNVIIGTWVYVTHTTDEKRADWLGQWAVVQEVNTVEQTEGDGGTVTDYTLIRPVAGADFDRLYAIPREAFKPIERGSVVYANSERVNPGHMWVVCAFTGPTDRKQVSLLQVSWLNGGPELQTVHSTTPQLQMVSGMRNVEPMSAEMAPAPAEVAAIVAQTAAHTAAVYATTTENYQRIVTDTREWKERLTARLHEVADENKWCSDFDDEMDQFGLARRKKEYSVDVMVTIEYVNVTVTAESEEEAIREVDGWGNSERDEAIHEWVRHNDAYWDARTAEPLDD